MGKIFCDCISDSLMEDIWENNHSHTTTQFTHTNVPSEFNFIQVSVLGIKGNELYVIFWLYLNTP